MKIEFSFNKELVEKNGYTIGDIYSTIKKKFGERNIHCIADDDILVFSDNGGKNDFSNMWTVIIALTRADWFLSFANSCIWYESENKKEDVLRQAREKINQLH